MLLRTPWFITVKTDIQDNTSLSIFFLFFFIEYLNTGGETSTQHQGIYSYIIYVLYNFERNNIDTVDHFEPIFVSVTKSAYADKFSFGTHLTQDDALGWNLRSDPDKMREVQEKIARNPGRRVILPDNPCHHGFHFIAVEKGPEEIFNLVSDYNLKTGELVYKTPQGGTDSILGIATWFGVFTSYYDVAGAQFEIWKSAFASPRMVLLSWSAVQ